MAVGLSFLPVSSFIRPVFSRSGRLLWLWCGNIWIRYYYSKTLCWFFMPMVRYLLLFQLVLNQQMLRTSTKISSLPQNLQAIHFQMNLLESQELQTCWCNFDRLAPDCIFSKVIKFLYDLHFFKSRCHIVNCNSILSFLSSNWLKLKCNLCPA